MNAPATPAPVPAPARRGGFREPSGGCPRSEAAPALSPGAPPRPVSLHIGRLVLDGLELGSREAALLQGAFEAELVARLGRGPLPSPGAQAALPAPALMFPPGARPAAMGRALARAVQASLAGPHRSTPP